MITGNKTELLTQPEFIDEAKSAGINMPERTLRYYITLGLLPPPQKIPGNGNVGYWDRKLLSRITTINELTREGESLESIKSILSSAQASDNDVIKYVFSTRYVDIRKSILEQLKAGKALNQVKKQAIIEVKTKFREEFSRKFDANKYKRLTNDFFHILSEHRSLFPEHWGKKEILEYFGFKPQNIDFNDRKAVRIFKINFFKKLAKLLKDKQAELKDDIEFCETSAKGLEEIVKKLG